MNEPNAGDLFDGYDYPSNWEPQDHEDFDLADESLVLPLEVDEVEWNRMLEEIDAGGQ